MDDRSLSKLRAQKKFNAIEDSIPQELDKKDKETKLRKKKDLED